MFRKKPKLVKGNVGFDENPGTFHIVYERKAQPDFGALEYAYESLALPPMPPMGPGVGWVSPMVEAYPRKPQSYVAETVLPAGIPQTAGFVYGQPMIGENGAPVIEDMLFVMPDSMLAINQPFADTRWL